MKDLNNLRSYCGIEVTLSGRNRSHVYDRKVDSNFEAHLAALSCIEPTEGFA